MSDQNYKPSFFVAPYYICELPNITLAFLRFYETIFQFWNKGLTCFLSNSTIMERTGIKSVSTINDAFQFFEAADEMKRVMIDGQRYIVQPERKIKIESTDSGGIAPAIGGYRSSDRGGIAGAIHNINNLNKETNTTTTSNLEFFEDYKKQELASLENSVQNSELEQKKVSFREEALTDANCIEIFKKRFSNTNVTLEQLYKDCCDYWSQKNQLVYKSRFLTHLTKCPVSNYPEKESLEHERKTINQKTPEQTMLLSNYMEYRTRVLADINLKLIPSDTYVKSFDEWMSGDTSQARME